MWKWKLLKMFFFNVFPKYKQSAVTLPELNPCFKIDLSFSSSPAFLLSLTHIKIISLTLSLSLSVCVYVMYSVGQDRLLVNVPEVSAHICTVNKAFQHPGQRLWRKSWWMEKCPEGDADGLSSIHCLWTSKHQSMLWNVSMVWTWDLWPSLWVSRSSLWELNISCVNTFIQQLFWFSNLIGWEQCNILPGSPLNRLTVCFTPPLNLLRLWCHRNWVTGKKLDS